MITLKTPPRTRWQHLLIPRSLHAARPYWFSYRHRERLELHHKFDESVKYNISPDQHDWNKLSGLSFNLFTNHQNSAMVAWRWNPDTELIELGMYYHKNGCRMIAKNGDTEVFATAKPGETISTYINIQLPINAIGITIQTPEGTAFHELEFGINLDRKTRVINPWFGGNQAAPHDILIQRKRVE